MAKKIRALLPPSGGSPSGATPARPNALAEITAAFAKQKAKAATSPAAKTKLPPGLIEGIAGAGIGHALDGLFGAAGKGAGSMLVGVLGKALAGSLADSDPALAATMDAVGTGALATYAAKVGTEFATQPVVEPLVEEATKAVEELRAPPAAPHVIVQTNTAPAGEPPRWSTFDPSIPAPSEPLLEEAALAVEERRRARRRRR